MASSEVKNKNSELLQEIDLLAEVLHLKRVRNKYVKLRNKIIEVIESKGYIDEHRLKILAEEFL